MKNKKIIIIGSSNQAKVVIDIIQKSKDFEIVGLIDDFKKCNENILGYKILGSIMDIPDVYKKNNLFGGIIAIGDNYDRCSVYNKIIKIYPAFNFVNAIHPSSIISEFVKLGKGVIVMAGVIINTCSEIGDFCLLNTNSSLDHDGLMNNFSSLAPNATTGGNVTIGKYSSISISAILLNKINIGENSIIGAGAVVTKDIPSNCVAYGIPAKIIRSRKYGDKYIK